jgi:hypothetical protein
LLLVVLVVDLGLPEVVLVVAARAVIYLGLLYLLLQRPHIQ